ncbi:MAG: E3 binding domain-containing protein [Chloroflexi bacterium]|nr:E3 binding domain-containing protein [Chloroflexota bacterium]
MVYEIVIPIMDQTTESVVLAKWLIAEGDSVQKGDIICEIETDKARVEIEATASGILRQVLIEAGTEIPPLTVIALLADANEPLPNIDPYYRTNRTKSQSSTTGSTSEVTASVPTPTHPQKIIASPRARRLAEEHGINLTTIQGSGPNGRIQEEDVLQAVRHRR